LCRGRPGLTHRRCPPLRYAFSVTLVLVASDVSTLRQEIRATVEAPDLEIAEVASGPEFFAYLEENDVDLAIIDMQMGAMGAMAITVDLRNDESAGTREHLPVLMLLDRRPDVFLARRSGAEGFLVKPLDPQRVRRAVRALLRGEGFEDDSWKPLTVRVGELSA